jgi:putative SOS response-associated peptidase YedK
MCYSAEVRTDYAAFQRLFPGTRVSIKAFFDAYWKRKLEPMLRFPKAMDALFAHPANEEEQAVKALIDEFNAEKAMVHEQTLFKQRARLVETERTLLTKTTKKLLNDQRVATNKVADALAKIEDLKRVDLKPRDGRIFPGWYGPVLVMEEGELVLKPMRYLCRPTGMPARYDEEYPGTYNARRDNLRKFWRGQFGSTHGLMIVNAFYENVKRHNMEHRELQPGEKEENVVLEFRPQPRQDMLIACLYSHWTPLVGAAEGDLWSFAAVTDEPPPEVADAGHDRCIIQLRPENALAWLTPQERTLDQLDEILDDGIKERPYYEHRMAA